MKSEGKIFEENLERSCKSVKPKVFYMRIRDANIPVELRSRVTLPKNKYDCLMFYSGYLFAIEMKSTKQKSISFDEKIIKKHQIDNLLEASTYEDVISGFIMNFREPDNVAYFIHIKDFVAYKNTAQSESPEHTYVKLNKSSIPIEACEQIGIKINNYKMKSNHHYHVKEFIEQAIEKFGNKTGINHSKNIARGDNK